MNTKRLSRTAAVSAVTAGAILLISSTAFAATTTPQTYHVMVMTHLCNSSIQTEAQFEAMENGLSPVAALAADVLACPTTGLPQNAAVAGTVAAPRMTYNYSLMTSAQTETMQSGGMFMPIKLCESDLGLDVNHDGQIATSTCLDISHYDVPVAATGSTTQIRVDETMAPSGYHFGTLRFTPVALDGNNDSEALKYINPSTGEINLNMVTDKDGMVMLHVYQFANATSTGNGGGTGTTTGGTGTTTGNGGGTGTTTGDSLGAAIRASVQAQIHAVQTHLQSLFPGFPLFQS